MMVKKGNHNKYKEYTWKKVTKQKKLKWKKSIINNLNIDKK